MKRENPVVVSFGDGTGSSSNANRRLRHALYVFIDGSRSLALEQKFIAGGVKFRVRALLARAYPLPPRSSPAPAFIPCSSFQLHQNPTAILIPLQEHAAAGEASSCCSTGAA